MFDIRNMTSLLIKWQVFFSRNFEFFLVFLMISTSALRDKEASPLWTRCNAKAKREDVYPRVLKYSLQWINLKFPNPLGHCTIPWNKQEEELVSYVLEINQISASY